MWKTEKITPIMWGSKAVNFCAFLWLRLVESRETKPENSCLGSQAWAY